MAAILAANVAISRRPILINTTIQQRRLDELSRWCQILHIVRATGYNVFAIPLAADVLKPVGILLSPAVGALFTSLSTVIVTINAQLLRRIDLSMPSLPGVSPPREVQPSN